MPLTLELLEKINTLTKYPSIPTYHEIEKSRGILSDTISFHVENDEDFYVTEKIDGTNSRIILLPDVALFEVESIGDSVYIIGSREELLYAKGDVLSNPANGIVDATFVAGIDLPNIQKRFPSNSITVLYYEVFGGRVGTKYKNYSTQNRTSLRLFDVGFVDDYEKILETSIEEISWWRRNGGVKFYSEKALRIISKELKIPLVPRISIGVPLPKTIDEGVAFMKEHIPRTLVALDDDAVKKAEGVVVRNFDRSQIAKLRYEDYARTIRKRTGT